MNDEKKIALIIDCDNAKADAIYGIMEELSKYGETYIRRAYGNFAKKSSWGKDILHDYAICPVQQFPYTQRKNATDLAMTIDVMEILYKEDVDIFAIVSSDSDFTPLAMKLRAKAKYVIGFGEKKTPKPFISSCNEFFPIDEFNKPTEANSATNSINKSPKITKKESEINTTNKSEKPTKEKNAKNTNQKSKKTPEEKASMNSIEKWDKNRLRGHTKILDAIRKAILEEMDDDGFAEASRVSNQINRLISLSPKNFGYSRWLSLIRATEYFEEGKNADGKTAFRIKK